ncbi:MAG: AI-2E family transporter [Candidatus Pseudobacter hemicellulosilyticus]|uniref:AI-2E family transporter n=1 Tax=Candidatus Pseudobacter hemicellulosilyticus TaxID=3121375 RepID=A0AAJ5WM50_9BACT|nr:MAG: AI-2E family transporter [Pseudobacter sp.]
MEKQPATPFYFRLTMILLMLGLIAAIAYLGQDIVVPFALSALVAILLVPVCRFLQAKLRLPRVPAILVAILLGLLFVAGIVYFLSAQVAGFLEDMDQIKQGVNTHLNHLQQWVSSQFGLSYKEQKDMLGRLQSSMQSSGQGFLGSTFDSLSSLAILITLLPIYTFLLLYYRNLIKQFFIDVFSNAPKKKVAEVLQESQAVIQQYMLGLIIEMIIVAVLNAVAFLILGIKYAIFLAVFTAILNLIPYIGMLIASVFCVLITLTTNPDFTVALWLLGVILLVQFIDNNLIVPKVVGSKVKLNALMTIIAVLIGGALCGVAGMFLSIPGIAILKVIFDRIETLQPWGRLLGGEEPATVKTS